jgi:hypothetical protein
MSAPMTRGMSAVAFATAILGLVAGLASGVPAGKALAVRLFSRRTLAMERDLAAFSAAQFEHADSGHARQAVLDEIRTLELLDRLSVRPPRNAALYLAYARLAMIEEAAGDPAAAQADFAKAAGQWSRLHPGEEISAEQMRQAVRDFDHAAAGADHAAAGADHAAAGADHAAAGADHAAAGTRF